MHICSVERIFLCPVQSDRPGTIHPTLCAVKLRGRRQMLKTWAAHDARITLSPRTQGFSRHIIEPQDLHLPSEIELVSYERGILIYQPSSHNNSQ